MEKEVLEEEIVVLKQIRGGLYEIQGLLKKNEELLLENLNKHQKNVSDLDALAVRMEKLFAEMKNLLEGI